jgi:hypothetical protein
VLNEKENQKMNKELPIDLKLRFENEINPKGKIIHGITPIDKNTYWLYEFNENAESFFDCFNNPDSKLYKTDIHNMNSKHIFRGHQNSNWELLPTAFRNLNLKENLNELYILKSGNGHILPELKDFINFIRGLNSLGYSIEDETFEIINSALIEDHTKAFNLISEFPKENQLKELALAQHYGVHTRLLDFTFNPNKAIFFAIEKIGHKKVNDNSKIGIWAIPERLIDVSKDDFYVKRIFVQGYQNKNLIAQEGLFLNYFNGRLIDDNLFDDLGKIKKLDEYLMQTKRKNDNYRLVNEKIGKPCLFTLSHKAVKQLMKKLEIMNINWLTIQPDLEGVKKEVERKKRYVH